MKISNESVHKALDEALNGVSLTEWERRRIVQNAMKPQKRRIRRGCFARRSCMVAATFALAVVLSTGVLAAVPGLAEKLSMLSRETLAYFTPIEQETTAQDIRMEVIAAMNDGDTAIVYVGLTDLSGQNRLDATTMLPDAHLDGLDNTMCDNVLQKPDGTVVLRLVGSSDSSSLSGRKVTLRVGNILSQNHYESACDTGYTVADAQAANPNPQLGSCMPADNYSLNGTLSGPLYALLESGKFQPLQAVYAAPMKDLPWVTIQNAGTVGNTFHILTNPDNDTWYDSVNFFLADADGNAFPTDTAVVDVGTVRHSHTTAYGETDRADQQEQLMELPADTATADMHIFYSSDVYTACIPGTWNVTFPLQAASASISAACSLDMQPWTATSVDISPIGVTVYGFGDMTENSLSPDIEITLADGTVMQDYSCGTSTVLSSEDGTEQNRIQMKSFFEEPLDTTQIARVTVNGQPIWQNTEAA